MRKGTFYWIFIIVTSMMLAPTSIQNSFSVVFENNPFYSMSNARIDRIKGYTSDGNLFVELEYTPDRSKKGELTFFKVNVFNVIDNKRTLHVDSNLIVQNDQKKLFEASREYGQPSIHSTNGIMLTQFEFSETGKYTVSVVIEGLNFFPIKPLPINFTATVSDTSNGDSSVVLSS